MNKEQRTNYHMAQKRMFDKAIIETDNFLNVSLSAKALYFLLGMEADDEGFVSPNRVLRIYGGEMGDLKNLIDTGLVIPFQSGVVVITHWKENNYLDKNRIKPTQYQNEVKSLLTQGNKYVLNNGLTRGEENRGEERSIEENKDQQVLFEGTEILVVSEEWLNQEAWSEWISYRKEIKKKMTDRTVKLQQSLLKTYSKEEQKMIIDASIRNGWTGLFELKTAKSNSKPMYVVK